MIILPNVPFEKQAKFLLDNICGYPDSPEFAKVLSEQATDVAGGLRAHQELLRRIYSDVACIEGKNDKEKYMGLVATMAFLYAFFAFGTLVHEHDRYSVLINKDALQQTYRTGDFAKRKRHLEHHGFSVKYLSAQGECESLSSASQLSISYDHHPSLVPAVKFFAESIESIQVNLIKYLYGKMAMFLKGDFEAGILRKPTPREALDPLRNDILDTVDEYKHEWTVLVSLFREDRKSVV